MKRLLKIGLLFAIFVLWFEKGLLFPINPSTFRGKLSTKPASPAQWVTFLGTSNGRVYLEAGDKHSFGSELGIGAERQIFWSRIEGTGPDDVFTPSELELLGKGENPWPTPK